MEFEMTSEKAAVLVRDILRRTAEGSLRWSRAPGNTFVAVVAGKLSLSYDLDVGFLRVSTTGPTADDLIISSHVDSENLGRDLDTELVVPELTKLRDEIERTRQQDVEHRVDEFLAILGKR